MQDFTKNLRVQTARTHLKSNDHLATLRSTNHPPSSQVGPFQSPEAATEEHSARDDRSELGVRSAAARKANETLQKQFIIHTSHNEKEMRKILSNMRHLDRISSSSLRSPVNNLKEMKNDEILQMVSNFNEEKNVAHRCLKRLKNFEPAPFQLHSLNTQSSHKSKDDPPLFAQTKSPVKAAQGSEDQPFKSAFALSVKAADPSTGLTKPPRIFASRESLPSTTPRENHRLMASKKSLTAPKAIDPTLFEFQSVHKLRLGRPAAKKNSRLDFRVLTKDPFFRNINE